MLCALLATATAAFAQASAPAATDFPRRAVTFVVPSPAGGGTDQVARMMGSVLAARWGVPVIIENKPGATGMLGAEEVAHSEATGYKLLFTFTALVQAPAVFAKVPYDLDRDFAPVAQVVNAPVFLGVRTDSPYHTVAEYVAGAKRADKPVSYGSFGIGSSYHIYGEALARSQKLNMLHVPYKGESLAMADLLGGQIDSSFISVGTGSPQVRAGKIRPLAMVSKSRSSLLPQVPTFEESGITGLDAVGWFGMLAPSGTPPSVVAKLAADVHAAVLDRTVSARMQELGYEPVTDSGPEAFRTFLHAQTRQWQKLISDAGVKAE